MTPRGIARLAVVLALGLQAAASAHAAQVVAREFFHAAFGHYFMTSFANEATILDQGTIAGWTRTANEFRVYDAPGPGLVPVCRFYTTKFAPKSSHFYSAFQQECEATRANADWTFETDAFHAALPSAAGECAGGLRPVYRLYNNGRNGAPNHKFTASASERSDFVLQGWTPEGLGNDGVAFCVPTQHEVARARTEALAGTTWDFDYAYNGTRTVRVVFGAATGTGEEELPWELAVTNRVGFAGYEPFGGRIVVVLDDAGAFVVLAFEFAGEASVTGCAYVTQGLLEGLVGRCYPLTGRRA